MYRETFNLFGRLLALLFFVLSTFIVNNPYIMLLNILVIGFLSYFYKQNMFITFLILILTLYNITDQVYFLPLKFLVILYYFVLFKKIMLNNDYIYIYEKLFYTFKNKKITNKLIKRLYYPSLFKNNINKYCNINNLSKDKIKYLNNLINNKTKKDLEDIKLTYYIRFYNHDKRRTNIIQKIWDKKDNSFIMAHITLLILSILYRG